MSNAIKILSEHLVIKHAYGRTDAVFMYSNESIDSTWEY